VASLVLAMIGTDRTGLVSAIAEVVARHGGNWEQSQMTELAGRFAGVVLITVPDESADELIAALEPLHGMLDITVQRGETGAAAAATRRFVLDLVGADRHGIVYEISHVLAKHGVNIELLETSSRDAPMSAERLFEAHAVLEMPAVTDVASLRTALERLADELMVDIDLDAEPA
jgi:glycine cleavage system regulatory protein